MAMGSNSSVAREQECIMHEFSDIPLKGLFLSVNRLRTRDRCMLKWSKKNQSTSFSSPWTIAGSSRGGRLKLTLRSSEIVSI